MDEKLTFQEADEFTATLAVRNALREILSDQGLIRSLQNTDKALTLNRESGPVPALSWHYSVVLLPDEWYSKNRRF